MKSFSEFVQKLDEVFVRGSRPRDGSKVLAYRENIWVWNNDREFSRIAPFINRQLGTDFDDEHDINDWIESNADAVHGEVENGRLRMLHHGNYKPSVNSPTLRKVISKLNLIGTITGQEDWDTGEYSDIEKDRKEYQRDLSKNRFYHGTTLAYMEDLLKFGLRPNPDGTNFDKIEHADKVFITTDEDKAYFHAKTAAARKGSLPIIIELKVPDPSRLVSDYDVVIDIIGADSELADELGYSDIWYNATGGRGFQGAYADMRRRYGDRIGQISTHLGIFGYKGRIPASQFTDIIYDEDAVDAALEQSAMYSDEMDLAHLEFDGVEAGNYDDWVTTKPSRFIKELESKFEDFREMYEDEEDY